MRKRIIPLLISAFALTIGMACSGEESEAKKIITKKSSSIDVVRGKTYRFSEVTRDAKDPWKKKENLYEALKGKSVKWSCASKKVKVKKKSFRVKKAGRYKLVAKTKKRGYILPVTAVKKVKTKICSPIYVTYDEKYKISQVVKDADVRVFEDIEGKNVTWKASSKEVVMENEEFYIKKLGDYQLIGTTRTQKYVIPISVGEKSVKHDIDSSQLSEVKYMTITSFAMGRMMVTITNPEETSQLITHIQKSEYLFDYDLTKIRGYMLGGIPYRLYLYTADGNLICSVAPNRVTRGKYSYINASDEFFDYVNDLFFKYYDSAVEMP